MSRSIRTFYVFALAVTALALAATGAQAKIVDKSKAFQNGGDIKTVIAKCPRGQHVTGGGYIHEDLQFLSAGISVYASHKSGQRAWAVSAQSFVGVGNSYSTKHLTTLAICSKSARRTVTRKAVVTSDATEGAFSAVAKCPRHTVAIAGGYIAPILDPTSGPQNYAIPYASYRKSAHAWRGTVRVSPGHSGERTTVLAYCAKAKSPTEKTGSTHATNASQFNTIGATSGNCPHRSTLVSIGYSQADPSDGIFVLTMLAPVARHNSGSAFVSVSNPGAELDLHMHAYCSKHRHKKH